MALSKKEIRVAIIGTGAISHRHMTVWSHVPQVKVVAAAEIDEPKLKKWGEQYHFDEKDLYTDFREMLKRDDIDAVDVCVHNNLHTPVAMAVMKAGYPCYSEKPMSASYFDSKLLRDCSIATGQKLAIQISSLYTGQTYIAKKLIDAGKLGDIYHARVCCAYHRRRNCFDRGALNTSPSFQDKEMAGFGQFIDLGIYHFGQMLFLLGLPELDCVLGNLYSKIHTYNDDWAARHPLGVEDMGVGYATFKGGLSLEIMEAAASNIAGLNFANVDDNYINGSKGGLIYKQPDATGGDWSRRAGPGGMPGGMGGEDRSPKLFFQGLDEFGLEVRTDYQAYYNQQDLKTYFPETMMYFDNQFHWYSYLVGDLTDETRYDTPLIGMNVSLLCDGVIQSSEAGRAMTAEEIKANSKSLAIWKQETPWGVFDYDSTL
ncbi:MAG: Gfo/Idh/MocA family oxidoreductase [Oscillospiraceae bacterium]|nr:Gfo/Idh/MocA family oxidoreductase [Oscillospiraceae bacterium]